MSQTCKNCRHVWPVNTHNIVFADSSEVCSGTVILGLVLSQFFRTKRQDNRPQHLIHVQLTDQMSLYNHQGCRPRFLNIFVSWGTLRTLMHKTYVCFVNWTLAKNGVKSSQLWHWFNKLLWTLQTQIKRHYKEKWSHYTIVKFKSLQMLKIFCYSHSNTFSLTFLLSIDSLVELQVLISLLKPCKPKLIMSLSSDIVSF